jgi:hypothetical protein
MERMTAADNAVIFFLHVMQRNPDLRYHSLGTELRSVDLQPKHRRRAPRLARALKHLESLSHELREALEAIESEGGLS